MQIHRVVVGDCVTKISDFVVTYSVSIVKQYLTVSTYHQAIQAAHSYKGSGGLRVGVKTKMRLYCGATLVRACKSFEQSRFMYHPLMAALPPQYVYQQL